MTGTPELASLIDDVTAPHREEQPVGAVSAVWPTLVKLGLADVGIPEEDGGSGRNALQHGGADPGPRPVWDQHSAHRG